MGWGWGCGGRGPSLPVAEGHTCFLSADQDCVFKKPDKAVTPHTDYSFKLVCNPVFLDHYLANTSWSVQLDFLML